MAHTVNRMDAVHFVLRACVAAAWVFALSSCSRCSPVFFHCAANAPRRMPLRPLSLPSNLSLPPSGASSSPMHPSYSPSPNSPYLARDPSRLPSPYTLPHSRREAPLRLRRRRPARCRRGPWPPRGDGGARSKRAVGGDGARARNEAPTARPALVPPPSPPPRAAAVARDAGCLLLSGVAACPVRLVAPCFVSGRLCYSAETSETRFLVVPRRQAIFERLLYKASSQHRRSVHMRRALEARSRRTCRSLARAACAALACSASAKPTDSPVRNQP